uniref:KxDL motif-containing protein 1 n=1 Tax=Amphiprion percula TaxID=161767 RepID=A0A3P8S7G9_AMPPE
MLIVQHVGSTSVFAVSALYFCENRLDHFGLSNVQQQQMNECFLLHTRTPVEMKKDLDSVFRRIRTLKGKIAKQYPEAFSSVCFLPLHDFIHPSIHPSIIYTPSEQSTESCDTSPDVSLTVSRCSENLSQELPDTPTSDILETAVLRDEGPGSMPAE